MNKREAEAARWLAAEPDRLKFSQWALDGAPRGTMEIDLVDITALMILARHGRPGYHNFGLPLEGVRRLLSGVMKALPAEHQVWIETMEAAYEEHLEPFMQAEDE